jgi:hypothetical protein
MPLGSSELSAKENVSGGDTKETARRLGWVDM